MSTIKVNTLTTLNGSGNITVSRPLSGSGASLTALNATELGSGTVPMARLSGTLPALNGSALTALNATQLTSGTIPIARIADNAVTLAKMAGGTDGQVITYDASGDPVAVGPGTDGQVLTSTGAGSPPAFEDAAGGDVVDDTTPQLGGDLDMNGRSLNFEDTNTVSTDPNYLDDYEEGTWTPTIQDGSFSNGEGQTYNTQYGSYVKIGRVVFLDMYMNVAGCGSISGGVYLAGLPFPHNNLSNVANAAGWYNVHSSANNLGTAGYAITGQQGGNSSWVTLTLTDSAAENSPLQVGEFGNLGNLGMSGRYETNS